MDSKVFDRVDWIKVVGMGEGLEGGLRVNDMLPSGRIQNIQVESYANGLHRIYIYTDDPTGETNLPLTYITNDIVHFGKDGF